VRRVVACGVEPTPSSHLACDLFTLAEALAGYRSLARSKHKTYSGEEISTSTSPRLSENKAK
jgi:hypothetical protein